MSFMMLLWTMFQLQITLILSTVVQKILSEMDDIVESEVYCEKNYGRLQRFDFAGAWEWEKFIVQSIWNLKSQSLLPSFLEKGNARTCLASHLHTVRTRNRAVVLSFIEQTPLQLTATTVTISTCCNHSNLNTQLPWKEIRKCNVRRDLMFNLCAWCHGCLYFTHLLNSRCQCRKFHGNLLCDKICHELSVACNQTILKSYTSVVNLLERDRTRKYEMSYKCT